MPFSFTILLGIDRLLGINRCADKFAMRIATLIGFLVGVSAMRAPSSCVNKGQVALVFSDGPVEATPDVMDALAADNVSATFMFSIVNIDHMGVVDVIRKAVEDGHTVGLRTNPIHNFSDMSEDEIKEAISMELEVLEQVSGQTIRYITINQPDVNDQTVLKTIDDLNLILINYNYDMYGMDDDPESMIDRWNLKLKSLSPQSTSYIVLQHDQRESELNIVPDVISSASVAGFSFVNMDECLDGATMEGNATADGDCAEGIDVNRLNKKKNAAFNPISGAIYLAPFIFL